MNWLKKKLAEINVLSEQINQQEQAKPQAEIKTFENQQKVSTKTRFNFFQSNKLNKKKQVQTSSESVATTSKPSNRFAYICKKMRTGLVIWTTGLIKEFSRVNWLKGKKMWISYAIVIQIIIVLALILFGISRLAGLII